MSTLKEQKDLIFRSGISVFARFLLFIFLYFKMHFQGEYFRISLLIKIKSGDNEIKKETKKEYCLKFSLEFELTG